MSSIAEQSLGQILGSGNKAGTSGRRSHTVSKRSVRSAGGKNISFQRRGRPAPGARSSGPRNGQTSATPAGRKAARIHNLKAAKLAAKSISQNHRDQIVQEYLKQQQSATKLVSKKVSVSGLPYDVNESSIRVCL